MALFAVCVTVMAQTPLVKGDVNGDGVVTAADVTALYDSMLGNVPGGDQFDVNGDGVVTAADVTALYDYLLGNVPSGDEHEYVDLGLPSGTLWAKTNVGASSPEDYGDYFAWGETTPKENYDLTTYKWFAIINENVYHLTKYGVKSYLYNEFVDGKTVLDSEDDAATANWGAGWCMPSKDQYEELYLYCRKSWTTCNGVKGMLFESLNTGASLFLPAGGCRCEEELYNPSLYDVEKSGWYWTCELYTLYSYEAHCLNISSIVYEGSDPVMFIFRDFGLTVRAVRVSQN